MGLFIPIGRCVIINYEFFVCKFRLRKNIKLSAKNQFAGKVAKIEENAVNGIVTIDVKGTSITSTINMNAIKELGLKEVKDAITFIKTTELMVATDCKIT